MKIVGLAGQSGTGKSTIAAHLVSRGGAHIDADLIAHELLDHDAWVGSEIRRRFGETVFGADGRIDRRRLGGAVFGDARELRALNAIVHPAVKRVCVERIQSLRRSRNPVPFVIIDAALLLEVEMPFEFDLMIALRCRPEEQFRRLTAKSGRSEEEIRARLESQKRLGDSFDTADVIIDTDRPLGDVLAEVDAHVDRLMGGERSARDEKSRGEARPSRPCSAPEEEEEQ
jgi:dephospho-CoA kinase